MKQKLYSKYPKKIVKQMRFISFGLKVLTKFVGFYGHRTWFLTEIDF